MTSTSFSPLSFREAQEQSKKRPSYTKRALAAAALTGGLAAGTAGVTLGYIDRGNADQASLIAREPACAGIAPHAGEGIDDIVNDLKQAKGYPDGTISIQRADGVTRTLANTPDLYDPTRNVQETDTVTVEHVDPIVCIQVGGHILANSVND
jgi:hypothetical protein